MPGEFDSVSKRIQDQLAKPAKEPDDVSLMSKILQEKGLIEKKIDQSPQVYEYLIHKRQFRIPKGTTILLFKSPRYGRQMMIDGRDFETIISSKDVVYDTEDVCLDPTTGKCKFDKLRESVYFTNREYFGFTLPSNDKNIPFILVAKQEVSIEKLEVPLDNTRKIKDLLKGIFEQND